MPLTPSHVAAVLPLRRLGLPTAALAIGSMVPDVPIFIGRLSGHRLTHSLTGVLTVDLVGTLLPLAGWTFLARAALVDLARLPARVRFDARAWLLAPVAAGGRRRVLPPVVLAALVVVASGAGCVTWRLSARTCPAERFPGCYIRKQPPNTARLASTLPRGGAG